MRESINITVYVPVDLHARAKKIAKKTRSTLSQLAKDGLYDHVAYWEARIRENEAFQKEVKSKERLANPLAPPPFELSPEPPKNDDNDKFYTDHIPVIAAVAHDSLKKRVAIFEAVAAIKKRHPMTSPKEEVMTARLNELVAKRVAQGSAPLSSTPPPMDTDKLVEAVAEKVLSVLGIKIPGRGED